MPSLLYNLCCIKVHLNMYENMLKQTSLIHHNEAFLWPNISNGRGHPAEYI